MYFNRKNAEQKNWRMIKKGKHFLFGCSLVFAVGAALVAPSVKADAVEAKPETSSTTEGAKPVSAEENPTYAAPAVEVSPAAVAEAKVEKSVEKPVETTQNSKEEAVATTEKAEKAKEADSIQAPEVTVVYDPSALTDEEKAKVVAAVKAANPTATDVQVQADGSAVVTFADGSRANLSAAQTIKDGSLVAKPRTNRAARATATRSSEGAQNLDYSNKPDPEGFIKMNYEVDNAKNTIHWTVVVNGGRVGNQTSGYSYFTVPKDSVGAPTNWRVLQTDKNGNTMSDRRYWKDNDGTYPMGGAGKMNVYTGSKMTKELTDLYKKIGNPAIKGNEAAAAQQASERSQALYMLTADVAGGIFKNPSWTITFDTPILDKSKPLDYTAGLQGTAGIGGKTNIMAGYADNFIDNASSKFQAVAVKEKYTAKVGGSFNADPATYVTNKAGTPEFPNNYRGATTFAWKDGQAPTATEAGTYTKTVVVTYPAHYKQAPQEVTITFEVKGNEASEIKEPTKTPVQDLTNLTQPEKDAVKKAIEDANPGKVANVEVTPDGTATVTFNDGSVATLTPDKTVVEAQSKGIQAPAKTPVQDLTNLTQPEKDAVKKAIEDANPGKVANVEVTPDGTATVTFKDGSVATLTPDKTVVEAQSKGIQAPAKTPVQDLTNLTQPEKDAVKKAIEDANPGKVANVEVTPDGTATVTFKDGSVATLTPDKTVVEAQSKGIQAPAKTPVQDLTNLTQPEKDAVKKAIEDANPGKVANVEVTPDGTATVTFKDGSVATLTPDKTVVEAQSKGIQAPAKTPVQDLTNLTQPEKDAVKKAIEDANPGKVANVEVTPDGTATVTFKDGSVATLTPDKTVVEAQSKGIVNPAKTPVQDLTNLTQPEKDAVKKAIEDANPGKVANVEVTPDGTATVTFNDGSVATLTPDKTVEKATKDADGIVNPAKTPVENPANLTEEEKGKVKKAIEDANPGKVANVEVTPDGTATVTFNDGSVATLTPDKTVEKATKDADGIVNPAKTPVENPANLTEEEKGKVKKAIEDANPGKVANVDVTPDGTATVTFNDGSVATLTPDKTVEKATKDADGIVNPAKTPVENPANLTEEEKGKVKKAIEDANPGKVANVDVTPDGTATVTFKDGSVATLTPDKTVEKATKDADGIVNPAKTPVENPANLTEEEKGKVKKAIEDANPGKVANVDVTPDGTATVTFNDGSVATLTPDKTVEKATKDADGIVNPAKTPVENPANLTEEEKGKVKKAIEDANPGKVANVEVTPDGTATVTFKDGSVATLTPDKTVEKATKDADGIVNPAKTPVENPANLTEEEKGKVKKAIEDANPEKVANVEVTPDGTATVTFKDGSVATLTPDKTVEKATKDADGIVNPAKTPVENPANLTEEEKGKVKKAIEDANPGKVANVDVTPDGTATVTFNDGSVATLTPDKTVEKATKDADGIVNPAKTPVENPANLTEEEKGKVKKAIEDANPGKVANVEVTPDGTATVTFKDGSVATLTPDKTVEKATKDADGIVNPAKTPVENPANLTEEEKGKVKKAIEDANPGKVANVEVTPDGTATVTFNDGSVATLTPDKTVEKATKDADGIVNPAKTPVENPANLTEEEKGKVKKAIEDANPGKVANVDVTPDGTATVTFKDGSVATLTPDKTVEKATKDADGIVNPAKTPVENPANLTEEEKGKVKKAIEDANPGKVANVDVTPDGTATVTFNDGSVATLTPDKTVEKATKDADGIVNPAKTPVENPANLTEEEKGKVKKAIEDANPGKVANVDVTPDGTATVTFNDGSVATLTPDKTVEKATKDADGIVNPAKTPVENPANLTEEEKGKVKKAIEDANPGKVANVDVTPDGTATVTFNDGSVATLTPDKTVEKATKDADGIVNPAKTPVENPANLTEEEKGKVKKAIEDANPGKVANVEVTPDGTATVTFNDGSVATLTPDKTVEKATKDADGIVNPAKTPVENPANLTEEEKGKVKKAIEDANPGKVANVEVTPDGTATVTFNDGSVATLTPDKTVEKATKDADGIVNPAKTPVENPANLTEEEKGKVKKAIEDANPGKVANVDVTPDGTATVTFNDGSVATLTPDKTVEKATKDADGIVNPAKTPVENPANLTEEEKGKVKKAIEDANPGKVANVEVTPDGTATVTFKDGSVATLTPDKTVEKATKDADGIVNPAKTPVENPANLTEEEKGKVKKAIEDANPEKVANVDVTPDGTATVTFKDGSVATLTPDKTVEKATKDADGIVNPAKTPVENPANLTEEEKGKVKKAIEDANPGKVANVDVTPDGTATVTFKDGSVATLTPDKTVEKATKDADGIVNPAKTPVENPANLTEEEKGKVKKAIEDANPGKVANVDVTPDGTATVTFKDGSVATLTPDKTVEKATKDADGIVNPAKTPVENPANLTEEEKGKVKKAIEDANPGKVANVDVTPDGTATVTFNDGSVATLTPDKTVKKSADKVVKDPAVTPVTDPSNLTDAEKAKVADEVKKANPTAKDIKVNNDGSVVVTFKDGTTAVIPADKTVKKSADKVKESDGVKNPTVTPVTDPSNLTDAEKAKVADEVKKANPTAKDIKVNNDGSVVVTFKDGTTAVIPADKTVKKSDDKVKESDGVKNPTVTPVTDPSNLTDVEKAKVADEVKKANPTAKDIKVNNDGSVVVTFADGSVAVIASEKAVKEATKESPAQEPAKKAGAKELPNTGTEQSNASLGLALLAAATGGLLFAKKRKEEE